MARVNLQSPTEEAADNAVSSDESPHPATPGVAELRALLDRGRRLLSGLGADHYLELQRLTELTNRLESGRFHLAILGQFKRGKSTLLNALLGEAVLPTSVVPLTAIPTFVRRGDAIAAQVVFQDGRLPATCAANRLEELTEFLRRFVTEPGNPLNESGVSHVEVTHPADILRRGVVLVDTPGIGSTLRHNTEAALNFLPQCDAALFLVSADPPVTEVEVEFLREVRNRVPRLFFILNKVDYLGAEERAEALRFLRAVLAEQVGPDVGAAVFCVSAREGLKARECGDAQLWEQSGMAAVERHLLHFLDCDKAAALRTAISRKAADTISQTLMRLRLSIRGLQMPLKELQTRLATFERKLGEIEQERIAAKDLLVGERRRAHGFLEEYSVKLHRSARSYLDGIIQEALACGEPKEVDEQALHEALGAAIPGFFEHEMGRATKVFEQKTSSALRPHQQRADRLIASVREAAAELFDVPYYAPESAEAFEIARQPYWVAHKWSALFGPLSDGILDVVLPARVRRSRVLKRLKAQVEEAVMQNVENLRWATYQSLEEAFIRFGSALDERLAETVAATHGAIQAALKRRKEQAESVTEEVRRLESAAADLTEVVAGLEDE